MEALASGARSRPRWLIPVAVIAGIALLVVLPLMGSYNAMVDKEASVDESFANLDSALQRRNDLIPNLVAAVRGALNQEQAVFGEIARARANYAGAQSPEQKNAAAGEVTGALGRLLVIVESFPTLQSNQNIRDLQVSLEGTENRINVARTDYNAVVTDFNRTIRRFPRSILAGLFGFEKRAVFTADVEAREAPTVNLDTATTTTAPR